MSINDGGSAFPSEGFPGDGFFATVPPHRGMSLRDYFAANALLAVGENFPRLDNETREDWAGWIARNSYAVADAMLKAREAK